MLSCLALLDNIIAIFEINQHQKNKPPLCICGSQLILTEVAGCYENSESLWCDCCNTKQFGKTNIYHCAKKSTSHMHSSGWDVCLKCAHPSPSTEYLTPKLQLNWKDCFVLLNVAKYLNGEDIYSLKSSITQRTSAEHMFDNVVKQLVLQRLDEFNHEKHAKLFEMATEFIEQSNRAEYIQKRNKFYWIYDMIGAKEPSLKLIDCIKYNNMKNTDWHRDDHRTFVTKEIFHSGNLYLIINILKFIKVNNYSLTNRCGSSVNQIDKILLKLILLFGKSLKVWLPKSKFNEYNTLFIEFAFFNLQKYIAYIRHKHFLHKLLNREIYRGNVTCVEMLRNKCKAPITVNSDPPKLFQTFRNPQYCMNIWLLMGMDSYLNINVVLCLKACYDVDKVEPNDLLDMTKLMEIVNYFMKPICAQLQSDQVIKYDKNEEILRFWEFVKDKHHILMNKQCVYFVETQIEELD